MSKVISVALIVVFAIVISGCEHKSLAAIMQDDPDALQRGKLIYIGTWAGYCHQSSDGSIDAPNLMDCIWLHGGSDQEIFNTIFNGVEGTRMIGFGGKLPEGDQDIWKLVAHLKKKRQC